ncbi:hypothetical protein [Crocinitomix catalasitica]|uniref:hypothetical protein n=1 Tax=Crocinitomix catalasitica TaxID=184607 RepID=UPI000483D497|nr:hypothetical protein [Crocinitomix catalasitica]
MDKQIKFFKLNQEYSLPDVKLGDSIEELKSSGILIAARSDDSVKFIYAKNENILIGNEASVINQIWFTRLSGCNIFDIDPYAFPYPAIEPITEYFAQEHQQIKDVNNFVELKLYGIGYYLALIFSNYMPNHIILSKNN